MIEFFQNLELLEEELLIRNDSVHLIYLFTKGGDYDNIATIKFHDVEDYNVKIIGGLVGTFHSFSNLSKEDTINSIQLNYLRILFAISEEFISVFAVDPDNSDEYYFKVIKLFLEALETINKRSVENLDETSSDEDEIDHFEDLRVSLEMIFSLIFEEETIERNYIDSNMEKITKRTNFELNEILKDIYTSHEKFFKKVIN